MNFDGSFLLNIFVAFLMFYMVFKIIVPQVKKIRGSYTTLQTSSKPKVSPDLIVTLDLSNHNIYHKFKIWLFFEHKDTKLINF